jgi:hypothetical protein
MYYLVNAGIRASEAVTIGHGRASGRGAREREQGAGGDAKVYTPEWLSLHPDAFSLYRVIRFSSPADPSDRGSNNSDNSRSYSKINNFNEIASKAFNAADIADAKHRIPPSPPY